MKLSLSLSLSLCASLLASLFFTVSTAKAQCPEQAQFVDCRTSLEGLIQFQVNPELKSTLGEDAESGCVSTTVQVPIIVRDENGEPQTKGYISTEIYVVFDETGFRYAGVSDNLVKVFGSSIIEEIEALSQDCGSIVRQPCGTSALLCKGRRALQWVTCKADNLRNRL